MQLAYAVFQRSGKVWAVRVTGTGVWGSSCTETGYLPTSPVKREDVRTASDAELLKSDHLELWWQAGSEDTDIRQLGIARLKNGGAHARWLYPAGNKEPLPEVASPAPAKFTVQLSAAKLFDSKPFSPEEEHETKFTVAFSDTDRPGKRQETLIATSMLKWADASTFGQLIWLANGARFPPLATGSRIELNIAEQK